MKGQVAASAVAVATLAREGWRPRGDLVFVAAADEEVGDGFGLRWLVQEHPDAVRADFAVNEGAGDRVELAGRVLYLCATAEKMSSPFRLRVRGRSGHASMPGIADNALVKAARLIERLGAFTVEPQLGPETSAFLSTVVDGDPPSAAEALALARALDPLAAEVLEPLLGMTVAPTMIEASQKRNVIPAVCDVTIDCRLLPGQTPAEAEAELRRALGDRRLRARQHRVAGRHAVADRRPLVGCRRVVRRRRGPGARVAPVCVPGFTDSHWLREAFDTVAYGFFPARTLDPKVAVRLIHSADERVPVEDLELGVRFLRHVARAVCE